jgi:bacteriorhodopsin
LVDGRYVATGVPFNDGYRYVDWLLTVPLLVAELVAVLVLPRAKSMALTAKLALAAVLMIALGYPGEVATSNSVRALWGTLSTLPFLYLLWVLWVELGQAAGRQPENVRVLLRNIRLLLLATWGFYPIVYMLPFLGIAGSSALVGVQIGYSIADVLAKCGYGLMIYAIARAKSEVDQEEMAKVPVLASAGNAAD